MNKLTDEQIQDLYERAISSASAMEEQGDNEDEAFSLKCFLENLGYENAIIHLIDRLRDAERKADELRAEIARLRAIVETPIHLPEITHLHEFDYVVKLRKVLKDYGLKADDDE